MHTYEVCFIHEYKVAICYYYIADLSLVRLAIRRRVTLAHCLARITSHLLKFSLFCLKRSDLVVACLRERASERERERKRARARERQVLSLRALLVRKYKF
jgi:hypothetical protein